MLGRNLLAAALFFLPLAFGPSLAAEPLEVRNDRDLRHALSIARPGTEIRVSPGRYDGNIYAAGLAGTRDEPIVIYGADAEDPPVIAVGNGWHFVSPKNLVLHDLVLTNYRGNGLNIDDGGNPNDPASGILLDNVRVQRAREAGNHDGIKLSGVQDFTIRNCWIEDWGSGGSGIDMVGCRNGIIEGCTLLSLGGREANGIQAKGGSSNITIRRCSITDAGSRAINIGGSTGLEFFRPKNARAEASQIVVEDCTLNRCKSAIAFVGVDGAIVRHNTIVGMSDQVIRILQENTHEQFVTCRNGRFENNVVVFQKSIRQVCNVGENTSPETFRFANNLWHCEYAADQTQRLVQLPTEEQGGVYHVDPDVLTGKGAVFGPSEEVTQRGYGVRPE